MRMLAIETATAACSIALFSDGQLLDYRHVELGRGHAERLVPMIRELPDRGKAEDIRVSLGPGSFTGVRIGLAAARALGLAWNARVLGYPTLALIATMARLQGNGPVGVCMHGGHGEWFVQGYDAAGLPTMDLASLPPAEAVSAIFEDVIAGNCAREFGEIAGRAVTPLPLLADARHVIAIPKELFTDVLTPLYGRPPDAKAPV